MTASSLLTFAIVLALGIALPGPTILALVTRVLTQGLRGCLQLCLGLLASDMVWLACAIFGFAALGELPAIVFDLLKWCGCAYLAYLARGMWVSATHGAAPATQRNATAALPGAGSSH